MIKIFIFTIVIAQLFITSGCGHLDTVGHDAPGKVGDRKFLDQLIGQSRETVFAELGYPDLDITQNEQQFLMYLNIVDETRIGAFLVIPIWETRENSARSCLRIELDSNSLVKAFNIKTDTGSVTYPSGIRGCLRLYWFKNKLQQAYSQVDKYLELMIDDPITAARMLCKNADDGYPLARYMLGDIYGYTGNNLANYVWYSLSGQSILDKEDWVEITGLDAKELDNALKEWQPGQCDPKIISKIITDNHEKLFGNSKNSFIAYWKRAIWKQK